MSLGNALVDLLIFPGLLYAAPMAWLVLWIERKALARMQGRIGPPFYQPFFDFIKLMAKRPLPRSGSESLIYTGLPLLALSATLGCLALLPVFPARASNVGDLVLLIALLEVAPICTVVAGFASRSIFGQVGAVREAVIAVAYNLPFITALVALAYSAGSLRLAEIVSQAPWGTRALATLALIACLPVKLRINPFSLVNAEQEIYTGPTTEFDGPRLALWELAHGLEWVTLIGLVISLALPWRTGLWFADALLFTLLSILFVLLLTTLAAGTARLKIHQATRFYWRWGFGLSLLALLAARLPLGG